MKHYKFFQNIQCEFFPCHMTEDFRNFNCLFCYCPLYPLKDQCGGNFKYLENGIKDCSECMLPHGEKGYEYIMSRMKEIMEMGKQKNG